MNDSGSQYLDGTIDTTRTLHFGTPTKEQKRAFTRVLQGHMAVINTVLPAGKSGVDLNSIARAPLWKEQLDFGHGVGHGVGQFGGVSVYHCSLPVERARPTDFGSCSLSSRHEGPQGISLPYPFKPGHVVTCEPGYYKEGHFGIRIESLILCAKLQKTSDYGGDWLGFELITRVSCKSFLAFVRSQLIQTLVLVFSRSPSLPTSSTSASFRPPRRSGFANTTNFARGRSCLS